MISRLSPLIKQNSLVAYFVIAYAISWAFMLPLALSAQGLIQKQFPYALYYLASTGPALSALIVTAFAEGRAGLRKLLGHLVKWRVGVGYYIFAVLVPVALFGIALVINYIFTGVWTDLGLLGQADYLPYLGIPGVLGVWFLTYGMGEEIGWRGFALPRLQRNRPAANAALLLGIIWACWHLPAFFFRDTYIEMGPLGFPMFVVSIEFASVVFAWLYNSTGGSLLLVILFHVFFNWLSVSEAGGDYVAILMSAPMVAWALCMVRRYLPENIAPVQRQVA
ncbi:MAG: type II CAAX endopeptidase family protein [Anaerolineales bacterium]|jgi:membrane protease YdiL (CAAX protease family)